MIDRTSDFALNIQLVLSRLLLAKILLERDLFL